MCPKFTTQYLECPRLAAQYIVCALISPGCPLIPEEYYGTIFFKRNLIVTDEHNSKSNVCIMSKLIHRE